MEIKYKDGDKVFVFTKDTFTIIETQIDHHVLTATKPKKLMYKVLCDGYPIFRREDDVFDDYESAEHGLMKHVSKVREEFATKVRELDDIRTAYIKKYYPDDKYRFG